MKITFDFISCKGRINSTFLKREVGFRWVAPPNYTKSTNKFPVLLMNDGQDFTAMELEKTLASAYLNPEVKPFIYVGIEADGNRIQEYGTANSADFKGRGKEAAKYSRFVIEEFIPFLKEEFKVSALKEDYVYCGMSLGGLSALDIAYNNPTHFSKIGVFSGSFWWRKKAYKPKDLEDRSRIILDIIKNAKSKHDIKFWFQVGSEDEMADRNKNGIIDAIDDTQDVIKELQLKGYSYPGDIKYTLLEGGKHNLPTWGFIFPEFIKWAFGK